MESRRAGVLIIRYEAVAELGIRQQGLGDRGRAGCHLRNPAGVRHRNPVQSRLAGCKLVVELAAQRQKLRANGVDRSYRGDQAGAFVRHVTGCHVQVFAQFPLDRQIPLLRIRWTAVFETSIQPDALAIAESGVDERRALIVLRESVLQQEGRRNAAIRA